MIKSVHEIIKRLICITYILNIIFGWSLDDSKIADTRIMYNNLTSVWSFDYFWKWCTNNNKFVWYIDQLKIKSVHEIIKRSGFITCIFNMIFGWYIEDKCIADTIAT